MERSGFIASLEDVEWRVAGNSHDYTFTGRAVVFDSWSEPLATSLGTFRERIMPGAFADVLERKPDVRLLFNHDESLVLARTKSGTLELEETEYGLHVWARVAPTSYAKDLKIVMARGDVDQMSFAFGMDEESSEDRWYEEGDEILRDIIRVSDLFDVSPVTFPAYVDTTAAMRGLRAAADAGKIILPPVASDPSADEKTVLVSAEATPVDEERDASAEAEPDPPVSGMAALKAESREAVEAAREGYLRSLKEITR